MLGLNSFRDPIPEAEAIFLEMTSICLAKGKGVVYAILLHYEVNMTVWLITNQLRLDGLVGMAPVYSAGVVLYPAGPILGVLK